MPSRPGSSSSRGNNQNNADGIGKLDYRPGGRPLLHDHSDERAETASQQSDDNSLAGSFFSDVAEGIAERDRKEMKKQFQRYLSFFWALINTLGAGGITAYSLYGPLFQTRLHYSQLQVNGVSITAMLSLYLPVPIWGILSDRVGPGLPSLLSGVLFGVGYNLAAVVYRSGPPPNRGGDGWPYWVMIVAFILIGSGTSCMYLSAVVTCAKNFGRGKYRGIAMAMPIACFGLSGMWQSQVGAKLLYERNPDGSKGDVDVPRYFLFLALYLTAVGFVGIFALRVVDEAELIDEAVEELEQSGLLEDSEVFLHLTSSRQLSYGTDANGDRRLSVDEVDEIRRKAEEEKARRLEQELRKQWLLNEETRRFLADKTMWFLLVGFFLVSGPGEAFVNNLGTVIGTLYDPPDALSNVAGKPHTTAATQVSITAITSTIARILTGTLTDIFAPTGPQHQHRRGPNSLANSMASLPAPSESRRWEVSRIVILVGFSFVMSIGQFILATGAIQGHGERFWIISTTVGLGYGAIFSLVPICVSVIWGVENFGTNWGVVATAPAFGATLWGLVYSGVYQGAADRSGAPDQPPGEDTLCYGAACYAPTFGAMAVSVWIACALWLFAWRGPGGWVRKGIAV